MAMTTPRDDIAGLLDDIKNRRLHHSYPYQLEELATSAATQLDSLLKEREALDVMYRMTVVERDLVKSDLDHWKSRALRAEQERDEAIAALKPMAEVAVDIPDLWSDDHQCVTGCGHFRRAARVVRRLASGPEKEKE